MARLAIQLGIVAKQPLRILLSPVTLQIGLDVGSGLDAFIMRSERVLLRESPFCSLWEAVLPTCQQSDNPASGLLASKGRGSSRQAGGKDIRKAEPVDNLEQGKVRIRDVLADEPSVSVLFEYPVEEAVPRVSC